MDRSDFYYRQRVTEAEIDGSWDDVEQALWDLVTDTRLDGIITGGEASEHAPQNMTIDLTAPCIGYDQAGKRCYFGTTQNIDCSQDKNGSATAVAGAGNHKYLSVILRFARNNTDARTDGNGATVYFNSDESFVVEVEQFAEGPAPALPTPPSDGLLLCNVKLHFGDTTIANADIDVTNRDVYSGPKVISSGWSVLAPSTDDMQAALDDVDDSLYNGWDGHKSTNATIAGAYVMSAAKAVTLYENIDNGQEFDVGASGSTYWLLAYNSPVSIAARSVRGWRYQEKNGASVCIPLNKLIHGAVLDTFRATWYQDVAGSSSDMKVYVYALNNQGVSAAPSPLVSGVAISGVGTWKDDEVIASGIGHTVDLGAYRYIAVFYGAIDGSVNRTCFVASVSHIQNVTDIGKAAAA